MASIVALFLMLVTIITTCSVAASAEEFVVGDEAGWTLFFNYQAWAASKDIYVGDKLVFRYEVGSHNVFKVNETAYDKCIVPPRSEAHITGNDVITLSTPGEKWFICGVHCLIGGQKLAVTVKDRPAPTPAPVQFNIHEFHLP